MIFAVVLAYVIGYRRGHHDGECLGRVQATIGFVRTMLEAGK